MSYGLCISGGGSKIAWEIGVVRRIMEIEGDHPTFLVGTSAGAILAYALSLYANRSFEEAVGRVRKIILGIRRKNIVRGNTVTGTLRLLFRGGFYSYAPLKRLISAMTAKEAHAPESNVSVAFGAGRVHVFAADPEFVTHVGANPWWAREAQGVSEFPIRFTETSDIGRNIVGVLASASIPIVFPPVKVDGRPLTLNLVDGGIANFLPTHVAFMAAMHYGPGRVYLIDTTSPTMDRFTTDPIANIHALMNSVGTFVERSNVEDMNFLSRNVKIDGGIVPYYIKPRYPLRVDVLDFSQGRELERRGYEDAEAQLGVKRSIGFGVGK